MSIINVIKNIIRVEGLIVSALGWYYLSKILIYKQYVNQIDPTDLMIILLFLVTLTGMLIYSTITLDIRTENVK